VLEYFPAQVAVILAELSEWVKAKITTEDNDGDPLPNEILLKNLEDTDLLEILFDFSRPEIDAFSHHDSFAAFSFYKISKNQFDFWVAGLAEVL
jgi:hypothetical protein